MRGELDRIGDWGPTAVWRAVVEAELSGGSGDDPRAWRVVLEQDLAPAHVPVYARYRLARALFACGDRDAAASALLEASAGAESLGAGLLVGLVADLARRARIAVTPGAREGVDAGDEPGVLTAHEVEVLRLVTLGRSNRQVGEELFISAKTASVHVSNILAKLGVSGRGEAAAVARETGLLDGADDRQPAP